MSNNNNRATIIQTNKDKNNNFVTLQFTLFDVNGRYKPISTLIKVESIKWFKEHQQEVKTKAIQQICNQRRLSGKELAKLGYVRLKVRNYDLFLKSRQKIKEQEEQEGDK